jgi:uncharacterized YigZ family protein
MKCLVKPVSEETEIKKSRFICELHPVETIEDVKNLISSLKLSYPSANHYCSAYFIGDTANIYGFDDDGEPSRTAGFPMLEVLKKNDITNTLAVVIRYFGGIKLGAGGLVRAYSGSVGSALQKAQIQTIQKKITIKLIFPYPLYNQVDYLVKEHTVISKDFTEDVHMIIELNETKKDELLNELEKLSYDAIKITIV